MNLNYSRFFLINQENQIRSEKKRKEEEEKKAEERQAQIEALNKGINPYFTSKSIDDDLC